MSNSKNTKRALLGSVLSILLSFAMLVGTTFAWFADSASSSVNTIQAGTLQLELQMKDAAGNWVDAEGKSLAWQKAEGAPTDEQVLWEPGCSYNLPELRVANKGSLALRYKIIINGIDGVEGLASVIKWTFKVNNNVENLATYIGNLGAGTEENPAVHSLSISAEMLPDAGNEYMGKSLENIGITVIATQDTVEYDSTTNEYDKDSEYPVVSPNELQTAMQSGGSVVLGQDIAVQPTNGDEPGDQVAWTTVTEDTVFDLNGKTLSIDPAALTDELTDTPVFFYVQSGATLTINGDETGTIDAEVGYNSSDNKPRKAYCLSVRGGNVVINGGNYLGAFSAIQITQGSLTINGGFFDYAETWKAADSSASAFYAERYLLWCAHANQLANGNARVSITGGTFVNFNPSNVKGISGITEPISFVAEGYRVESDTKENNEIWYTVVPDVQP